MSRQGGTHRLFELNQRLGRNVFGGNIHGASEQAPKRASLVNCQRGNNTVGIRDSGETFLFAGCGTGRHEFLYRQFLRGRLIAISDICSRSGNRPSASAARLPEGICCRADSAGNGGLKYSAYTLLKASRSEILSRYTVVETTWLKSMDASSRLSS